MKFISKETKSYKLLEALKAGEKFTASQAEKRFGIKNISAEASRLRHAGYAVYSNSHTAGNGVLVTTYELGRASREIVALGYKAKSMGITL
jgi:Helix-turn-helix domain